MNIFNLFRKKPSIPQAPEFVNYRKVFLRDENDLNWRSYSEVVDLLRVSRSISGIMAHRIIISGAKLRRSKDRQDEDAAAIRIHFDSFRIQGAVFEDIPGGVKVFGKAASFQDCQFTRIGEDAVSNFRDASSLRVIGCKFWNESGGDKSLQINNPKDALVAGCDFYGGETAIRLGKKDWAIPGGWTCRVTDCSFAGCATALNVDGNTVVRISECNYTGVGQKALVQRGSRIVEI